MSEELKRIPISKGSENFKMTSQLKIRIPKEVNPDLQEERRNPSFNVQKLADRLNGGAERNKMRKEIGKINRPSLIKSIDWY